MYTASSVSLATLGVARHHSAHAAAFEFVITSCTFPEVLVDEIDETQLPPNWRNYPTPPEVQQIGTEWLLSGTSAVLSVPSAVTPEERNYLLNPEHEHFRSVDAGSTRPFKIDLRLLT